MTDAAYDSQNIFARILRGEIPAKKIYEDDYALAFPDIAPKAPVHILVIPKGAYRDVYDFGARAGSEEIAGFARAVSKIIAQENLESAGFRVISNCGLHGGQEVPHYHVHILGGKALGAMI